jgi:hypothetical protein
MHADVSSSNALSKIPEPAIPPNLEPLFLLLGLLSFGLSIAISSHKA